MFTQINFQAPLLPANLPTSGVNDVAEMSGEGQCVQTAVGLTAAVGNATVPSSSGAALAKKLQARVNLQPQLQGQLQPLPQLHPGQQFQPGQQCQSMSQAQPQQQLQPQQQFRPGQQFQPQPKFQRGQQCPPGQQISPLAQSLAAGTIRDHTEFNIYNATNPLFVCVPLAIFLSFI